MMKGNSPIMNQMIKIFRHTRAGSYGTRARYQSSCSKFISFLDQEFGMKNLRNLQDKHLIAYVKHRQSDGISAKTIKNDLGAIRYMHDQVPRAKHELSPNNKLGVELDKVKPSVNRAWTEEEYRGMKNLAEQIVQSSNDPKEVKIAQNVRDTMILGRTMGLRITEATAMSRAQAVEALKTNEYQVKGEAKNGKWRKVRLSPEAREMLNKRLKMRPRGSKVFVQGQKTHETRNDIAKFIAKHRNQVTTTEGEKMRTNESKIEPLRFHGLRYSYIQKRMEQMIGKGMSKKQAASLITKEVGHNRTEVIKIYLGKTN